MTLTFALFSLSFQLKVAIAILLKLFFRELKLQKRLLLTKATWKAIHQSLMEEVVLNENGAVNFRFFFLNKD